MNEPKIDDPLNITGCDAEKLLNFQCSAWDFQQAYCCAGRAMLIRQDVLSKRAIVLPPDILREDAQLDFQRLHMDLLATHCNGCELDFHKLLYCDVMDFVDDVVGIARNINRRTGRLENAFLPKCAKGKASYQ